MGGIFSKPKTPKPDPSIAEAQKKQEARLTQQETAEKMKISSRARARRSGGLRLLMSSGVPQQQQQTGGPSAKLGGGV